MIEGEPGDSASYKVKLVRDGHVEALKRQHEDPIGSNPWVVKRPYDQFTDSHVEYTKTVLMHMRMERDQTLFRLKQLDDGIEQAEVYLESIIPDEPLPPAA